MAKKYRRPDNILMCSSCDMIVDEKINRCYQCYALFDGIVDVIVCPVCSTYTEKESPLCKACKNPLKISIGVNGEGKKEEDFLVKLIQWSKKSGEAIETMEDKMEKLEATAVLKDVIGVKEELSPETQKDTTKEFISRGKSLANLAEPMDIAINARNKLVKELKNKMKEKRDQLSQFIKSEPSSSEIQRLRKELEELVTDLKNISVEVQSESQPFRIYKNLLGIYLHEVTRKDEELAIKIRSLERKIIKEETLKEDTELNKKLKALETEKTELLKKLEDKTKENEELNRKLQELNAMKVKERENNLKNTENSKKGDWLNAHKKLQTDLLRLRTEVSEETKTESVNNRLIKELTSKVTFLEERIVQLEKEKSELEKLNKPEDDKEVKQILKVLDELLGNLPDDLIDKFAKSDDYKLYEKILNRFKI